MQRKLNYLKKFLLIQILFFSFSLYSAHGGGSSDGRLARDYFDVEEDEDSGTEGYWKLCPVYDCQKPFQLRKDWLGHMRNVHLIEYRKMAKYECSVCSRRFIDKRDCNGHASKRQECKEAFPISLHGEDVGEESRREVFMCKELVCEGRVFTKKGSLDRHMQRTHRLQGNRKIKCSACDCRFEKKGHWRIHVARMKLKKDCDEGHLNARPINTERLSKRAQAAPAAPAAPSGPPPLLEFVPGAHQGVVPPLLRVAFNPRNFREEISDAAGLEEPSPLGDVAAALVALSGGRVGQQGTSDRKCVIRIFRCGNPGCVRTFQNEGLRNAHQSSRCDKKVDE